MGDGAGDASRGMKDLPWANHAAAPITFKHGEGGHYMMEFWITPFDYAGCEGPQRAVESQLYENKIIGISWAIIDQDGPMEESWVLESFEQAHDVWDWVAVAGVSADAAGAAVSEGDRRAVEF